MWGEWSKGHGASLVVACLVVALAGCGDPEVVREYRDLPVIFDGDGDRVVEESLVLGALVDGAFVPLGEGAPVEIINGFQGGTWVHLSVRVSGMPASGVVRASLEGVGEIRYGLKLTRTADGFLEAYDIPMPVRQTGAELEALFGVPALLTASFEADGRSVEASLQVVLAEGG